MNPTYDDLLRENAALKAELARLRALIEELHRGQKRQAAPFSKGPPNPNPQKPGRKPGEDYGTKAYRKPPDNVDEVLRASLPCTCPACGGPIQFLKIDSQYQWEIPRRPILRRILVSVGRCRRCRRRVQGRHPLQTSDALGAACSQLGPDAQAVLVHLNKDAGLSHGKVAGFFRKVFGIPLSRGGSAQAVRRAGRRCRPAYRTILSNVRRSPRVVPDESGWKVGGLLQWLHAFATEFATAYVIRPSRGYDVPCEVLGADYAGDVTHDGWAPYDRLEKARHQQCIAHLLRRCGNLLKEAQRGAVRFPRAAKAILLKALALRDRRDDGAISSHGLATAIGRLEARLSRLLTWPRSNPVNARFAKHLAKHFDQLFTFLRVPGLDATNWRAEQAIRPAVVNRKVWGGNRTPAGAEAQEILMSILRTCAQQGRDGIEFLSQTLRSPPVALPRLLPARMVS